MSSDTQDKPVIEAAGSNEPAAVVSSEPQASAAFAREAGASYR